MRKNSGFTIVEQAIVLVPEFEKVVRKLEQQVTFRGQEVINLKISDVDTSTGSAQVSSAKPFISCKASTRKIALFRWPRAWL